MATFRPLQAILLRLLALVRGIVVTRLSNLFNGLRRFSRLNRFSSGCHSCKGFGVGAPNAPNHVFVQFAPVNSRTSFKGRAFCMQDGFGCSTIGCKEMSHDMKNKMLATAICLLPFTTKALLQSPTYSLSLWRFDTDRHTPENEEHSVAIQTVASEAASYMSASNHRRRPMGVVQS